MAATVTSRWTRWLARAERRLPALTRLKRVEALPIALDRRRIYVLPTRFGFVYSTMLVVMLLGALNYSNNPALLLTLLLGAAAYQSVFTGFAMVNRLALHSIKAQPCHAGDTLTLQLHFDGGTRARRALRLLAEHAPAESAIRFEVDGSGAPVQLKVATTRRGWQPVGRLRLSTEYPFGLFHIWSWLHPDVFALVYPRAERDPPPWPEAGADASATALRRHGDEFSLLREYRPSDPRRLIAWKASARHRGLLVKELERPENAHVVLDWHATHQADPEARITRLAAWVLRADERQVRYTLLLPGEQLGPALGEAHRNACLRALALWQAGGT